jgi:hypothetical protein
MSTFSSISGTHVGYASIEHILGNTYSSSKGLTYSIVARGVVMVIALTTGPEVREF